MQAIRAMAKTQLLLVAPDIQRSETTARPLKLLHSLLQCADDHAVPVVFCLSRRSIGSVSQPLAWLWMVSSHIKQLGSLQAFWSYLHIKLSCSLPNTC